jgi:hypothetical protein
MCDGGAPAQARRMILVDQLTKRYGRYTPRISTRITNEVPGVNPGRRRHEQALEPVLRLMSPPDHPTATKE